MVDFDVKRAIPVSSSGERQPAFDIRNAVPAQAADANKDSLSTLLADDAAQNPFVKPDAGQAKRFETLGKGVQATMAVIRWPFWRFIEHPVSTLTAAAQEGKVTGKDVGKALQAFVPFKKIPPEEYGSYGQVWNNYYQAAAQLKGYAKDESPTPDWYVAMASFGSAGVVEPLAIKGAAILSENAATRVATPEEAAAVRAHFEPLKTSLENRGLSTKDLHVEGNIIKVDAGNEIFVNKYLTAVLRGDEIRVPRWAKIKMPSNVAVVPPEATPNAVVPTAPEPLPTTGPEVSLKAAATAPAAAAQTGDVPQFKNTQEAAKFGEANKDNPEVLKGLQETYQSNIKRLQEIRTQSEAAAASGDMKLSDQLDAEGLHLAQTNQFYREAVESATKTGGFKVQAPTADEARKFPDIVESLKKITEKINQMGNNAPTSLIKQRDALQKAFESLQADVPSTPGIKKVIRQQTGQIKDQGKMISERNAFLQSLKDQVKAARQAEKFTREQVFDTQTALTNLIDKSDLAKEDKAKFIRTIKNVQTGEDLAKLLKGSDKASGLEERINTLIDKAERRNLANDIKDIKTGGLATEYEQAIKKIQDSVDLKSRSAKTLAKREQMREFVARMKAEGKEISIPKDMLDLLDKPTLNDINIDELKSIKNTVDHLARLGKTKLAARESIYQTQKENIKAQILEDVQGINSKVLQKVPVGGTTNQWAERYVNLRNHILKTNVGLTPMEGLADVTGMQKVKGALDKNFGSYLSFNDDNFKKWYALTKDFDEGNFNRIGVYSAAQQEGGIERLVNSGVTQAEAEAVKLTPAEKAAYDFARTTFDKYFPEVERFSKEVYNEEVGKVENYVSFLSNYDAMSDLEMYDRFGQRPQEAINRRTKTVEQGFRKSRAELSNIKLETNIDKIFRRHLDDVAYMLTMGRDIKMYSEIVNSPEMREALGDVGSMAWLQWLDLMARKGGVDAAKRIALLDVIRRNTGAGVLAFRLSSALVQFSSFGDTMATLGADWAMRGAKNIATSARWRSFIMDNFPEVRKAVGDDIAFREFGEDMIGKMSRVGMMPLQAMDGIMRSTAASAAYEKVAADHGMPVDLANPDKELIEEATKLMRQSQGSSFFKDQPLATTAGYGLTDNQSLNKTLLQFQSFMLSRWDNIVRQVWRLGVEEKDYKKAIMSLFWLVTFGFGGEEVLRRASRAITQPGKKEKPLAQDIAFNALQSVPIAGQVASSIAYSSSPVPIIKTMQDAIDGASSVVNGKTKTTKIKGLIKAAGAAGSFAGVPGSSSAAQFLNQKVKSKKGKIRD